MVTIIPYQSTWPDEFQRLAGVLRGSFGDLALRIDHIGSTSIPGLTAAQAHLLTDSGDDFPGLTSSDRLHQIVGFVLKKVKWS